MQDESKISQPPPTSYSNDYFAEGAGGKAGDSDKKKKKKEQRFSWKERLSTARDKSSEKDKERASGSSNGNGTTGAVNKTRSSGSNIIISLRSSVKRSSASALDPDVATDHSPRADGKSASPLRTSKGDLSASADAIVPVNLKIESDRKTIQVGNNHKEEKRYVGVSLSDLHARDRRQVPVLVADCIKWLWQHGTQHPQVFAEDAGSTDASSFVERFEKGKSGGVFEEPNMSAALVTSVLKIFFAAMPDALFTFAFYETLANDSSLENIVSCIAKLPPANAALVKELLPLLSEIARNAAVTKMPAQDLAFVLGPLLLRPRERGADKPSSFPKASVVCVTNMITKWQDIAKQVEDLRSASHANGADAAGSGTSGGSTPRSEKSSPSKGDPSPVAAAAGSGGAVPDLPEDDSSLFSFLDESGFLHVFELFKQLSVTLKSLYSMSKMDLMQLGLDEQEGAAMLARLHSKVKSGGLAARPPALKDMVEQDQSLEAWEGTGLDPRVHKFLVKLGLENLVDLFEEFQIDWTILDMSAMSDFTELGLDDATIRKIMNGLGKDPQKPSEKPHADEVDPGTDPLKLDPKWIIDLREIRVQKKIGIGGYAEVWRALWKDKVVAFKLLQEETMDDLRVVNEFRREMVVMSSMDHPNIVAFYGSVDHGRSLAMVLEYAARGDLEGILLDHKTPIPYLQRLRWAKQVAQGLHYLHTRNPRIIHRDIKSANILVDELLCTKICDFGLAKRKTVSELPNEAKGTSIAAHAKVLNVRSVAVQFTTLVGTPAWTAPELIANRSYTEKVDIYSFGVFLWELMCRQTPHEGMPHFDLAYAILSKHLRPAIPSWMPETISQLMKSCWAHKPEFRPTIDVILKIVQVMLSQPKHDDVAIPF